MSDATDPALRYAWEWEPVSDFAVESLARQAKKFRDGSSKDADLSHIRWRQKQG